MSARGLISVIIPTHNRSELVVRAVENALRQTYTALEVIVVDDASTDDTLAKVEAIADPRVHYIRSDRNIGGAAARNLGVRAASGEFVAFLDSDDLWFPGKLKLQMKRLSEMPESGVVYCREFLGYRNRLFERQSSVFEGDVFDHLARGWSPATTSNFLVQTQLLLDQPFDEALPGFQDYDLWLRLARLTDFAAVDRPLTVFEQDVAGPRLTKNFDQRRAALEIVKLKWLPEMQRRNLEREFLAACEAWRFDIEMLTLSHQRTPRFALRSPLFRQSKDFLPPKARVLLFVRLLLGEQLYARTISRLLERRGSIPRQPICDALTGTTASTQPPAPEM